MLKKLAFLLPLMLLFCALADTSWSSEQQPQNQYCKTSEPQSNCTPQRDNPTKIWRERLSIIWNRTWDDPVAFYTFILSIFTALLALVSVFQIGFLMSADKTARLAAQAADLSARSAIGLQLPIIRMRPGNLSHGHSVLEGKTREVCAVSYVNVVNIGATKAFPQEVVYGWTVGSKLPRKPRYTSGDKFPINYILNTDADETIKNLTGDLQLKEGEWEEIREGNHFWFYCKIIYEDFMGETRSHGFCWRWANVGMGLEWRIDDTKAYNQRT